LGRAPRIEFIAAAVVQRIDAAPDEATGRRQFVCRRPLEERNGFFHHAPKRRRPKRVPLDVHHASPVTFYALTALIGDHIHLGEAQGVQVVLEEQLAVLPGLLQDAGLHRRLADRLRGALERLALQGGVVGDDE